MAKPKKKKRDIPIKATRSTGPEKRRGRPEKLSKIDDTPLNVARALWGERSTKFTERDEE